MAGDPNYLLVAGGTTIGGKVKYSDRMQSISSWTNPTFFAWKAPVCAAPPDGPGLVTFGTYFREIDPASRVGLFFFAAQGGFVNFRGGFQGDTPGASIYAALRFNPPPFDPNATVSPSTSPEALPIKVSGEAFNRKAKGLAHQDGMLMSTIAAMVASGTGRANAGTNNIAGFY